MTHLTPERIAALCDDIDDPVRNRGAINRLFREQDESHLWPIDGRFDATERAIRRTRAYMRDSGHDMAGLEYAYAVDSELCDIVNNCY